MSKIINDSSTNVSWGFGKTNHTYFDLHINIACFSSYFLIKLEHIEEEDDQNLSSGGTNDMFTRNDFHKFEDIEEDERKAHNHYKIPPKGRIH